MTGSATIPGREDVGYSHTQVGWWTMIIVGAACVLALAAILGVQVGRAGTAGAPIVVGVVLVVLLATLVLFSTLNVRVTSEAVIWRFGPGPLGGRIALDEIEAVTTARTPLWAGLGIHWIFTGWVYNVSGRDAVAIRRHDGSTTWVGTDEPDALREAIERARGR